MWRAEPCTSSLLRMGNPFIVAESMTIFVRGENKSTSTT
jgi:hypothetical protein